MLPGCQAPAHRRADYIQERPPSCFLLLFSDYISVHSGILSALGNFLAQLIEKKREKENCSQKLDVSGPLRYAIYGAPTSLLPF
uniref:Uncharacterized protein n=1 Tax=Ursus maritimus TaxID=29073 RepID=A0A452T4X2_URSMA